MPREWHPLRFFVREDDRRHPTVLFWLFSVPIAVILIVGGCSVLNPRGDRPRVTMTPTVPATETMVADLTRTPETPTGEPTPTAFMYDDPSDWEFVERTDPTGKKYLDLQDWQREQVWHAFEEFWDLLYHNESGLPEWAVVQPFVDGPFVDFARGTYSFAEENEKYLYIVEGIADIPHRAVVLESSESGDVQVKVVLGMERSYQIEYRDPQTGVVLEEGKWLPYRTWSFIMSFQGDHWVINEEEHELFEQ